MPEMACPAFEDRILEYADLAPLDRVAVDEHLHGCAPCRDYLQLLQSIDMAMADQLRAVRFDAGHVADVRQLITGAMPVTRVSRMPEWLDLVAAGAVVAFVYGLVWQTGLVAYLADAMRLTLN